MHQFTFPSTMYKGSLFSTFSSASATCGFLFSIDSHSEGRAQWALIGISLMKWQASSHVLLAAFPPGENVYSVLPIFQSGCFFLMFSCMTCSCILDNNPLLALLVANIFSHSVVSFFIHFVDGFLCCAKAFQFN